jgi:hypothetical protein
MILIADKCMIANINPVFSKMTVTDQLKQSDQQNGFMRC